MPLSLETQKGLELNMASEDPTVESRLKAVSLLIRHSILACNTTPAAGLEGSILLCNDYTVGTHWSMCKLISLG